MREELERHASTTTGDASGVDGGVLARLAKGGASVLGFVGGFFAGAVGLALAVFLTAFCFVYFSMSFPAVAASIRSLVPAESSGRTLELLGMMDRAISGFVRGRILVCSVVGLIYAVGWTMCGVPHGWLLGLATGLASLVPYLAALGLPLAWLLLIVGVGGASEAGFYATKDPVSGHLAIIWWKVLLFPALVNVIAQALEDYVLNPLIQGKATNLHPVAILLAAIAGGSLAGLYGLILAIPAAACIKILLSEVLMPRIRAWLAGTRRDPLPVPGGEGGPAAGV
ncbi:MAG: AI-2E family transporter [Planctomycetes bacterium]|nr:AI-2E family transporter [Planctomycetota bacterium]